MNGNTAHIIGIAALSGLVRRRLDEQTGGAEITEDFISRDVVEAKGQRYEMHTALGAEGLMLYLSADGAKP